MSKTTLIKIEDTGKPYYTLSVSDFILGRRYDNNADMIEVVIPEAEKDNICIMMVCDINGKVIDHITFDTNIKPITDTISQYESVRLSFYFMNFDNYIKNSQVKTFTFLEGQKPYDFEPTPSHQNQNIDYLIQYGFTNSQLNGNTLEFYNMNGQLVKSFDFSPFMQEQSDLAQTDSSEETFVKNKSTKYLANEGANGTDTYAEMGDVSSAVGDLKDDLLDGTVEVAVATNVSTKINGHNITDIFENDGTTAKSATKASQDGNGDVISDTYVPKTRKVNDKALSADITLTPSDVGAQPEITNEEKLDADLVDDSESNNKFVSEQEKQTWNNKQDEINSENKLSADLLADGSENKIYTASEQTKLSGIESGAQVNTVDSVNTKTGDVVLDADDISDENTTNKFTSVSEKNTWNGKQDALPTSSTAGHVLKSTNTSGVTEWGDLSASDVGALSSSTKYGASLGISGISVQLKDQDGNNLGSAISVQDSSKADKTDAVGSIELTLNSTTYVMTLQAKNVNGQNIGTAQTIDLPLESIVSSATYYDSYTYDGTTYTKVIVLVLSTTSVPTIVPVGELVSGLQSEITSQNKLSADLIADGTTNKCYTATEQTKLSGIESGAQVNTLTGVKGNAENSYRIGNVEIDPDDLDDTNTTNKFVTSSEKSTWSGKQDALPTTSTSGKVLKSTSTAGTTEWGALSASDVGALPSNTTYVSSVNGSSGAITNVEKTTNKVTSVTSASTDTQYPSAKCVYDGLIAKENTSNKTNTLTSGSTTYQYPNAKIVYETFLTKENSNNKVTSLNPSSTDVEYPSAKCVYDAVVKSGIIQLTGTQEKPINLATDLVVGQLYSLIGNIRLTSDNLLSAATNMLVYKISSTKLKTFNCYFTSSGARNSTGITGENDINSTTGYITSSNRYSSISTLNGDSSFLDSVGIYAPTSYGTSGYLLESKGSGNAPTFTIQKVTSISNASTDNQIPTAKAIYDYIASLNGTQEAY